MDACKFAQKGEIKYCKFTTYNILMINQNLYIIKFSK